MALRIPNWLKTAEATVIGQDMEDLFADAEPSGTIDYHLWNAGAVPTVNLNTGVLTNPWTVTSAVPAFVGEWKAHQIARYPSLLLAGDLKCLFRKSAVSGSLGTRDRVVYSAVKYEVVWVRAAQFGAAAATQLVCVSLRRAGAKAV